MQAELTGRATGPAVSYTPNDNDPCPELGDGPLQLSADSSATTPSPAVTPPPAEVPAVRPEPPLTVIEPRANWTVADVRELWRFRELFAYLTLRDLKVRYKQTILGVGWSVFQPLATLLVFVVFFGRMGRLAEGVTDYTLFVLAGVLPWTFFANAVSNSGNSLVGNERLVTKTYFPRVLLPGSNVAAALFDFSVGLALMAVWLGIAGVTPTWRLVMAPVCVLLLALTAAGVGSGLAALIATHRDFRYILGFGVQLWMFATPCLYLPPSAIGPRAHQVLPLNPAYGLILNFRASVLGEDLNWSALAISSAVGLVGLAAGLWYFRRMETTLADTI